MIIDSTGALVDNDFFYHLTETSVADEQIFAKFFEDLQVIPFMHELVYKYEFERFATNDQKSLFTNKIINQALFNDIFNQSAAKKKYYKMYMTELYKNLMGAALPVADIFTEWKCGMCLGEVHSVVTCLICGCGLFLSDDADSKILEDSITDNPKFLSKVIVYNRNDACSFIKKAPNSKLDRAVLHRLNHEIRNYNDGK